MKNLAHELRAEVPHCSDPKDYSEWENTLLAAADRITELENVLKTIRTLNECYDSAAIHRTIKLEIESVLGKVETQQ